MKNKVSLFFDPKVIVLLLKVLSYKFSLLLRLYIYINIINNVTTGGYTRALSPREKRSKKKKVYPGSGVKI